jgi:multidrug efflux pump subunit AcrA (membrane-fusion protein)
VPNADRLITPGQFGRVRVPGSQPYDAVLIPDSAVVTDQSRKLVMTLSPDNVVTPRPVKLGPSQPGGLRIVRDGLKSGDKLVIDGLVRARPGSKVTPKDGKVEPVPGMTTANAAS